MHELRPRQLRGLRVCQADSSGLRAREPAEDAPPVDSAPPVFAGDGGACAGGRAFFAGLYPHIDHTAPTFAAYSPSLSSCDASGKVIFGCLMRSRSHARNGAADIDSAHWSNAADP